MKDIKPNEIENIAGGYGTCYCYSKNDCKGEKYSTQFNMEYKHNCENYCSDRASYSWNGTCYNY